MFTLISKIRFYILKSNDSTRTASSYKERQFEPRRKRLSRITKFHVFVPIKSVYAATLTFKFITSRKIIIIPSIRLIMISRMIFQSLVRADVCSFESTVELAVSCPSVESRITVRGTRENQSTYSSLSYCTRCTAFSFSWTVPA